MEIKDISYDEIGKVSAVWRKRERHGVSTEQMASALYGVIDSRIVDAFGTDMLISVYDIAADVVESNIQSLIKEKTGEVPVPAGTMVRMAVDMGDGLEKGSIVKIESVSRMDEDTFGQGWYRYRIDGAAIVYRNEFEVMG